MTKADNGPTFLTNFGVRQSVDADSRLENIRKFFIYEHLQQKLLYNSLSVLFGNAICFHFFFNFRNKLF